MSDITIRRSTELDRDALGRLAELDSKQAPQGDSLLAYVSGELVAAVPLASRQDALADPFHLTGDVVQLLELRARQERLAA